MKRLIAAVRSPPSSLSVASIALASGRQIGMVTGMTNEATLISMGHSRHSAVVTPGLPQEKKSRGEPRDFLSCRSQAKPTDFLE